MATTITTPLGTGPRRTRRWRILAAGAGAMSMAALVGGLAFAFLNVNGSGTGSATTGALALTLNAPATHACTYSALAPGDLIGTPSCTLSVTYSGAISGWVGLDVLIATKAQAPGTLPLYNPSDASHDLQITISDNQSSPVTYVTPSTSFGASLASCPSPYNVGGYTCYQLANLLVSTAAFTNASPAVTFTLTGSLPSGSGNSYQHGTASVVMTAHAVQSPANALLCTATPTPGKPCVPAAPFSWS